MSVGPASVARVFAGAVLISFSPVLFKVSGLAPTGGSFWRTAVGGVFLLALAAGRGERPLSGLRNPGALRLVLLCAAVFTLDLEFWHRSIPLVGPGLATILTNFQAVLLAVYGVLLFGERPGPRLFASIVCALAGLWLLLGVDVRDLPAGILAGVGWGLGAAFWYSLYVLAVRRTQARPDRLRSTTNMAWISLATALFVGATGCVRGADLALSDSVNLWAVLAYGVGPQALGWLLISQGLPGLPASVAGLIILAQPALAFIWDILFFHRPAGPTSLLGAVLALAAIYAGATGKSARTAAPAPDRDKG